MLQAISNPKNLTQLAGCTTKGVDITSRSDRLAKPRPRLIHPKDLVLRDYGWVTSYGPAARTNQLAAVLPATVEQNADLDHVMETGAIGLDTAASQALNLARMWRRLGELHTWRCWSMPRRCTKY